MKKIRTEVIAIRLETNTKDENEAMEKSIKFWVEKYENNLEKFLQSTIVA